MTVTIRAVQPLTVALVLSGLTLGLGYGVQRGDFAGLLALYGAFFAIYAWLVLGARLSPATLRFYLALGVFLRILLLFSLPNLSDDVFRFLWDGRLIVNGIHPFAHPPAWFADNQIWPDGLNEALFKRLNSPDYYTVYPPVCQGVFALAAWLAPHSMSGGVFCIKLFLLGCEMGSMWLLSRHRSSARPSIPLIYALNPLIILEIVGNCHFEGAAIFFLLAAVEALRSGLNPATTGKGRALDWSALLLALSIASKLVPLLFVPLFARWLGWKKGMRFLLFFALAAVLLFLPLLDVQLLRNMAQSLDLYFQKFAFNASVYYVLWEIGLYFKNYNMVNTLGPAIGAIQIVLMALVFWRLKPGASPASLRTAVLVVLCVYLFGASTVHPWYVTLLLAVAIAPFDPKTIGYPFLFVFVWTGTVVLSYSHYDKGGFSEHKGLVAVEYALLAAAWLWEANRCQKMAKKDDGLIP